MSIKWNLIRLGGPAHGIVTKTVQKTLPGGGGPQRWVDRGTGGDGGPGVGGCWVGGLFYYLHADLEVSPGSEWCKQVELPEGLLR